MSQMIIEISPGLRLRPASMNDLAQCHAIMSDPKAMRYWSTLPHENLERTRIWLEDIVRADPLISLELVLEQNGKMIGKIGVWKAQEVGFILHPDAWGKGLASMALAAFIPVAFANFNYPELTADVDPRNTASLKLLQRHGFVITGRAERTFLLGDEWCDSIYLALARP